MIKKIILFLTTLTMLYSCGYTPILSNKKNNEFNIEIINSIGDRELNNFISQKIKRLSNKNDKNKKFLIEINTNFEKKDLTKNLSGDTTQYRLTANVNINVKSKNFEKVFNFKEKTSINNFDDEFKQTTYERSVKENLSTVIINKLIMQLTKIE